MTNVNVVAVFTPVPGAHDALVAALREGIPAVHAEPGCELYAIHDAEDGRVFMLEKWTTAADLDAHSKGEAVAALGALIAPHLAEPVEVILLHPLPAGTDAQGLL